MSGPMLGVWGTLIMLVLLFVLRMPAGFVMAIVGFIGIAMVTSLKSALNMIGMEMWNIFSSYGLTVIPMFILVGEFIHHAGYSDGLYRFTNKWFGHYRGGLAITTVLASAGFSAICGSNTATAATMSAVALPAMKKYHYHPVLGTGAIAAGATLGVVIPPSVVLVVYGLYTGQSIGKLFFGALIPGALLVVFMSLVIVWICHLHPDWGPPTERATWKERIKALPAAMDILFLFAIIMTALLTGWVTATEAAAAGCSAGLILCVARRKLTWKAFVASVRDTLRISCMVFMIVAGAKIFGSFINLTRLPFDIAEWIGALNIAPWMIVGLMLLCFMIGGCVMDALAFLLVALPIFFPLIEKMGYDPIWFGALITVVTTMGAITPPVGICCYVVSGMARDIPIASIFRGILYYLPAYIVTLILMMLFPYWTVLILSNLVR